MLKFSCTCQNHAGTLSINDDDLSFTSSLLRVKLGWDLIKKINLDTKQIKGVPTSVLVLRLVKHKDSTGVLEEDDEPVMATSKKYYFYGFQDLLGAEEHIKAAWEKARADGPKVRDSVSPTNAAPTNVGPTTTVKDAASVHSGVLTTNLVPDKSMARKSDFSGYSGSKRVPFTTGSTKTSSFPTPSGPSLLERAREWISFLYCRFFSFLVHVFLRGGYVVRALGLAVCLSLLFAGARVSTTIKTKCSPLYESESLMSDLDNLKGFMANLGSYSTIDEFHRMNNEQQYFLQTTQEWIDRLSKSAMEFGRSFVTYQLEMTALRGRRAKRVGADGIQYNPVQRWKLAKSKDRAERRYFLEGVTDTSAGTKNATCRGGLCSRKSSKSFTVQSVADDISRWGRILSWIWTTLQKCSGVRDLFLPTVHAPKAIFSEKGELVRYSEVFLEGYDLIQYISEEEKAERDECIQLSNEMLELCQLMEDLLAEFTSVLMLESYEKLSDGTQKNFFWTQPVAPNKPFSQRNSYRSVFTGEEILQVALVRRYVQMLIHMNPLQASEHRRRTEAIDFGNALNNFAALENELFTSNNRKSKDDLLHAFSELVMQLDTAEKSNKRIAPLRNIIEEIKFWNRNEDLWIEHILASLPLKQQRALIEMQANAKNAAEKAKTKLSSSKGKSKGKDKSKNLSSFAPEANESASANTTVNLKLLESVNVMKWNNLPIFKGLLCFTQHPTLIHVHRDFKKFAEEEVPMSQPSARVQQFFQKYSLKADSKREEKSGTCNAQCQEKDVIETLLTTPTQNATPTGSSNPSTLSNLYRRSNTTSSTASLVRKKNILAKKEVRFDALVSETKKRWLTDLQVFLMTIGGKDAPTGTRSYMLEEQLTPDRTNTQIRTRLFSIISDIGVAYSFSIGKPGGAFKRFFATLLWPPHWFRRREQNKYDLTTIDVLRQMGTADPAAQLISTQVLGIPWGSYHDVSLLVVKNILLQPPDLTRIRIRMQKMTLLSWLLLLAAVIILVAMAFTL